jgi:hypothetical protein
VLIFEIRIPLDGEYEDVKSREVRQVSRQVHVCWSESGSAVSRPRPSPGTSNGSFHDTRPGGAPSPEDVSRNPQAAEKRSAATGQEKLSTVSRAKF